MLVRSSANTGLMHESFNVNNVTLFTRPWFAWANSMLGELLLQLVLTKPHLVLLDDAEVVRTAQAAVRAPISLMAQVEAMIPAKPVEEPNASSGLLSSRLNVFLVIFVPIIAVLGICLGVYLVAKNKKFALLGLADAAAPPVDESSPDLQDDTIISPIQNSAV
jgi:hypothetical protein